jgi:general stress protein 26
MTFNKKQALNSIRQLLGIQTLGVLATQGKKYPYSTLVGFAASDDLKTLFFATIRDTRKYQNIQMHSQVSMLIDSRTNQVQDFKDAQALTVLGSARDEKGPFYRENEALYLEKHPYLKDFLQNPNCAFMRLDIDKYIMVDRFQEVIEIELT